jgi:hypothetical protein
MPPALLMCLCRIFIIAIERRLQRFIPFLDTGKVLSPLDQSVSKRCSRMEIPSSFNFHPLGRIIGSTQQTLRATLARASAYVLK